MITFSLCFAILWYCIYIRIHICVYLYIYSLSFQLISHLHRRHAQAVSIVTLVVYSTIRFRVFFAFQIYITDNFVQYSKSYGTIYIIIDSVHIYFYMTVQCMYMITVLQDSLCSQSELNSIGLVCMLLHASSYFHLLFPLARPKLVLLLFLTVTPLCFNAIVILKCQ